MKKVSFLLIVVPILYWIVTMTVPPIVDSKYNKVLNAGPYPVSAEAESLYRSLDFVADLHCDALLWERNLLKRNNRGQVDVPRMVEARMALQAFTIVTKSPKGQNMQQNTGDSDNITALMIAQGRRPESWFSLYERALDQCDALHDLAYRSEGLFRVIHNQRELIAFVKDRAASPELTGGFLGVEGGHCLEGELQNLNGLWEAGVRMLGPTHFFDNELGGSAHGVSGAGLTDFGKQVIDRMNQLGMIIDVAHASEAMIDDILAMTDRPIITSHTGVKGLVNSPRNLSDEHLKAIARSGGLIGVAFFPEAIGDPSVETIVGTMKYVKDLVGYEHVALGSDFDGSVTTLFDCTGLPMLVEQMMLEGFTEEEIRGIMGENVKRFLLNNLPQ